MLNKKSILFLVFLIIYVTGVCMGSTRQVLTADQSSMYEYLEQAMSGYSVTIKDSIKSILKDNLRLFLCLLVGGFFLIGPLFSGAAMLIKGYSAGFAITAVLRFYGIYGLKFCIANLVSAAICVPMLCWYCGSSAVNIWDRRYDRREFIKHFLVLSAVILLVIIIDSCVRGFLSAVLLKFSNGG